MEQVYLRGTEDVMRASRTIQTAADSMRVAAGQIDSALTTHRGFLDDWLQRFETVMNRQIKA